MPVNLANVNISLQQFQSISSGKYNAGEVRLESETTLGKLNHHVGGPYAEQGRHRRDEEAPRGWRAAFYPASRPSDSRKGGRRGRRPSRIRLARGARGVTFRRLACKHN